MEFVNKGISFAHALVSPGSLEINKPSQLLRSHGKNTSFVVLAQECFCLSRMTSEISHGTLLIARFRIRLLEKVCYQLVLHVLNNNCNTF